MGVAALGVVDLQPHILQLVAELADLCVRGILFQYNDHGGRLLILLTQTAQETGSIAAIYFREVQFPEAWAYDNTSGN